MSAWWDALPAACRPLWERFDTLVAEWNQRTSLVASGGAEARQEVLFRDAWEVFQAGWLSGDEQLLDIGAGVGAPAIPLALLYPRLRLRLVEPRRRRVTFLRFAIGSLNLAERVGVQERRLEASNAAELAAGCDIAMSRATFSPSEWLNWAPQLAEHTWLFCNAEALPSQAPGLQLLRQLHYQNAATQGKRTLSLWQRRHGASHHPTAST